MIARSRALVAGGAVAAVALVVGVAVAVTGGDDETAATTTTTSTTTTTTTTQPVTTTTQPPTGPIAPLTGLRLGEGAPVGRPALAVKIDNLDAPGESALPQAGLSRADVVFEEIVEGNITRLVAVFHSRDPGRVGPVRSARTTDVHLLPQLGRPLLAWSGGNEGVTAAVRSSGTIVDLGWDARPGAYARDRSRPAPHNLFADGNALYASAPADAGPPPALFSFRQPGQPLQHGANPSAGVDLSWGGGGVTAPVSWTWDEQLRLYRRQQRGRPHVDEDGSPIVAQNVVVLVTDYGRSAADTRSPEAITVGGGEAFFFTNGAQIHGRWERSSEGVPAALFADDGAPILLTPGQTWVELPRAGTVAPR